MLPARRAVAPFVLSVLLAACGRVGTTSEALLSPEKGPALPATATGSVGPAPGAAAPPPPGDPTDRALQVAATSARASRCGFYFDPGKLRARLLAAEAEQGAPPEVMQKVERAYDYARAAIAEAAAKDPSYCSEGRAALIKADLERHLAGDFTPRAKKDASGGGLLAAFGDSSASSETPFSAKTYWDITGGGGKAN